MRIECKTDKDKEFEQRSKISRKKAKNNESLPFNDIRWICFILHSGRMINGSKQQKIDFQEKVQGILSEKGDKSVFEIYEWKRWKHLLLNSVKVSQKNVYLRT